MFPSSQAEHPPLLRGPDARALRQGPLQAGAWPAQRHPKRRREDLQGLHQVAQVLRLLVPQQAAEASSDGPHVHRAQKTRHLAQVPRGGAPAPLAPALDRPGRAHVDPGGLPERGQVKLRQQSVQGRRGGAALRLHDQVALRRALLPRVPALAGHRHPGRPGPPAAGAVRLQHHRDAGGDRHRPHPGERALLRGPVAELRVLGGAAVAAVRVPPAGLRREAGRLRREQERPRSSISTLAHVPRPSPTGERLDRADPRRAQDPAGGAQQPLRGRRHRRAGQSMRVATGGATRPEARFRARRGGEGQARHHAALSARPQGATAIDSRLRGRGEAAAAAEEADSARDAGEERRRRSLQRQSARALGPARPSLGNPLGAGDLRRAERFGLDGPRHRGQTGRFELIRRN